MFGGKRFDWKISYQLCEKIKREWAYFGKTRGNCQIWNMWGNLLFIRNICVVRNGCFTKQFLGGILILAAFMPVRVYAGGFHEQTRLKCIVRTSMLYLALLYCLKYSIIAEYVRIIIIIIVGF